MILCRVSIEAAPNSVPGVADHGKQTVFVRNMDSFLFVVLTGVKYFA